MSKEVTPATCVELARRAWDFRDAALGAEHVLSADRQHDLTSLLAEADELGLMRLFRVDEYDKRMLGAFDAMQRLCDKLLEAADVTSGHERIKYDPGSQL